MSARAAAGHCEDHAGGGSGAYVRAVRTQTHGSVADASSRGAVAARVRTAPPVRPAPGFDSRRKPALRAGGAVPRGAGCSSGGRVLQRCRWVLGAATVAAGLSLITGFRCLFSRPALISAISGGSRRDPAACVCVCVCVCVCGWLESAQRLRDIDDLFVFALLLCWLVFAAGGVADLIERPVPVPSGGLQGLRPTSRPPWMIIADAHSAASTTSGDGTLQQDHALAHRAHARGGEFGDADALPGHQDAIRSHVHRQLARSFSYAQSEDAKPVRVRSTQVPPAKERNSPAKRSSPRATRAKVATEGLASAAGQQDSSVGNEGGKESWKLELDCAWSSIPHPLKVHRGKSGERREGGGAWRVLQQGSGVCCSRVVACVAAGQWRAAYAETLLSRTRVGGFWSWRRAPWLSLWCLCCLVYRLTQGRVRD